MNRKIYLIGMMALAMLFASCKKEEKPEVQEAFSITASIENDGSKTYLEASKVKWIANSDKIDIWDQTVDQNKPRPIVFTCKKVEGTGTEANFTSTDPIDDKGKYWAFYPNDACSGVDKENNTYTFTIPATQDYKEGGTSFADGLFPMAAHFSTNAKSGVKLQFKNACGILKIHATGNTTITAIRVTDNNHALWGTFSFNIDDREDASKNWGVSAADNSTNHTLTLKINPAITLNNDAKDFYMVLPPGCLSDDFTVEFINGSTTVKSASGSNKPIGRSKLITANTSIKVITSLTGMTQAISSSPVNWANNDQIKVYDKSNHGVVFTYNSENSNFTCSNGCIDDKGEYWAFFDPQIQSFSPSLNTSNNTFTFTMPSSQNYDPNGTFQRDLLPMAVHYSGTAGSTDITLRFQNAFGVLKISATGNTPISQIVLTDNSHALCGKFNMDLTNLEPTITSENDNANHTLTLNISPAVTLTSTPKDFYMILPPGCLNGSFTMDFINGSGTVKSAPASNKTISRSARTDTEIVDASKVFSFTVDGDGKQVQFSSGNLRCVNGSWSFQPNQWSRDINPQGLFYFSNNKNHYGATYEGNGLDTQYVNWGETIGTGWRLLSCSEWQYIISHNAYRSHTYVNGQGGLVIMPDGWSGTIKASYGSTEWEAMEADGAVFLPWSGAGMYLPNAQDFSNGLYLFPGTSNYGEYWCSDFYQNTDPGYENEMKTYGLYFDTHDDSGWVTDVSYNKISQHYGYAVRLVKDL